MALSLAIGDERLRIALRDADRAGEGERPVAHEQHVTSRLEDLARDGDRVRHDTGESGNGPALQAVSLHDRGVRLDRAVAREDRAAARVEAWIVLEGAHGGLDRVERGAAGRQHPPSRQRGRANALAKLGRLGRIRAGAAMDDDRGNPGRHCLHRVTIPSDCKIPARSRS